MSLCPELAADEFSLKAVEAGGVFARYLAVGRFGVLVIVPLGGAERSLKNFWRNVHDHAEAFHVTALHVVGRSVSPAACRLWEVRSYELRQRTKGERRGKRKSLGGSSKKPGRVQGVQCEAKQSRRQA